MTERESASQESGPGHMALVRRPTGGFAVWWDPRRSLGARLALLFLPLVLLPVLFYWRSSEALVDRVQQDTTAVLEREATAREQTALKQAADRRVDDLSRELDQVLSVGHEAAAHALRALRAGPSRDLPPEPLVDVPGAPLRTAERGGSAAIVSRLAKPPATLRDLSATRRVETSFGALVVGHPSISAVFVATNAGVLRAVPWCDVSRLVEAMSANFHLPGSRGIEGVAVSWTPVYDDLYAHRGRIVSAIFPVRETSGALVGEVGVDWVFGEMFTRGTDQRRKGEVELVYTREGTLLFQVPDGSADARAANDLRGALKGAEAGERETTFRGEPVLVSARAVPASGWTYVRVLPLWVVRESIEGQLEPVFKASRRGRTRLQVVTLLLILLVGGPLVAVVRRATAPVRGLARYADRITRGGAESPGPAPGTERKDEVGRLSRALENVDRRIRRRIRSMEGLHDLARTGAVMTRPDETFARLSRRIAELVGAAKAWFALWDPESRSLVFTPPGYGVADEVLRGVCIALNDHSLALLAYRTGETYVSNDVRSDPRISLKLADLVDVHRNAVFVPLKTEAGTQGVLIVCDKPEPFEPDDEAAIQIYADEAALLLRNARLYEELQQSFERLRDAHRNRDYFLQNINHELRTPLTAILGWSEVLAEDQPDKATLGTGVEQIRRSAQFLLTLISDLLDLSRFEEGRTQLERTAVDVGALVREAVDPVAVMAEAKGIAISVAAPDPGTVTARVDALRTRQVLWNLVHNAVKFTMRGGCIEIVASRDASGVTFTVADDGVGIDPKDLPFIFERFRQGDGSTTRAYRGTGIGLALAKAYVELHGGRIEAENRPVRGALFRVFLPDPVSDSSGSLPRPKFRL